MIAATRDVTPVTVRAWRAAFVEHGLTEQYKVARGPGRKPSVPEGTVALVVKLTTTCKPDGPALWSCRTMAERVGVSATMQRIWSEPELQPHRADNFKVSNDPHFDEKVIDVVGLYLNHPRELSCSTWTRRASYRSSTGPGRHFP